MNISIYKKFNSINAMNSIERNFNYFLGSNLKAFDKIYINICINICTHHTGIESI